WLLFVLLSCADDGPAEAAVRESDAGRRTTATPSASTTADAAELDASVPPISSGTPNDDPNNPAQADDDSPNQDDSPAVNADASSPNPTPTDEGLDGGAPSDDGSIPGVDDAPEPEQPSTDDDPANAAEAGDAAVGDPATPQPDEESADAIAVAVGY